MFVLALVMLAAPGLQCATAQEAPEPEIDLMREPGLLWTIPGSGENEILDIVDGTLYFIDEDRYLHAIDTATGEQRWMQPTDYLHRFEVVDGTIFASNGGLQQVYAFDVATGALLWTVPVAGEFFWFTVLGDLVYIEDPQADELTVVDAATGGILARYYGGWWLDGERLYFGVDGMLQGIDARLQEPLWAIPLDTDSYFEPAGDFVFIRNRATGRLTSVDSATGQTRWVEYVGGRASPKIISDDTIYVRGEDAALFALDLATGEQRWVVPTGVDESDDYSARFVDGAVYIHADRLIAIDDRTGEQRWVSPIGADYNNTRIVDGTVYSVHRDASEAVATPTWEEAPRTLSALDAASGEELWSFPLGAGFSHIENVGDKLIYVRNDADTLFAIETATGKEAWSLPAVSRLNDTGFERGVYLIASGETIAAIDLVTGEPIWAFAADSPIVTYPYLGDDTIHFQTEEGTLYGLGDQDKAAAQIAEAEAAESLAAAWDAYLGTDLPGAFTANVALLPGMNVISFDIGINVDTFSIPEGYERIIAFPVRVPGGASATWSVLTIFPSSDEATAAMTNMSGGLLRSGWIPQEVDGLDHDHACLSLSTAESSQALCYMTREDALIISHSTVPVPTPDAALMNVTDLANAMSEAYDQVDRPN